MELPTLDEIIAPPVQTASEDIQPFGQEVVAAPSSMTLYGSLRCECVNPDGSVAWVEEMNDVPLLVGPGPLMGVSVSSDVAEINNYGFKERTSYTNADTPRIAEVYEQVAKELIADIESEPEPQRLSDLRLAEGVAITHSAAPPLVLKDTRKPKRRKGR